MDLLPPLLARLAEIENVRYVKESTMDVTRVRDIALLSGGKLTVFGGIMGFESFLEGANGWVSVASNVVPRETADNYTLWPMLMLASGFHRFHSFPHRDP